MPEPHVSTDPPLSAPKISFPVVAVSAVTLATIIGFAYLFSLWISSGELTPLQTLHLASSQYVAGSAIVAGELAAGVTLDEQSEADQPWISRRSFLIGAGLFEQAMLRESPRARREGMLEALPFLTEAAQAGFPAGRTVDGHRMLGLAAQQVGDYDTATIHLQDAMDSDIALGSELAPVLAVARARRSAENLGEAIDEINEYLSTQTLDAQQQTEANLLKIGWLIRQGRFDKAEATLADVRTLIEPALQGHDHWALGANDAVTLKHVELTLARIRSTITRAHGERTIAGVPAQASAQVSGLEKEQLSELLKQLSELQREAAPKQISRSRIVAAQAFLLAGESDLALAELTRVRQQRPFGEEGLQGGMSEMELLADQGLGEEVLQTARYLVREMLQSRELNFTPQDEAEFRSRVTNVLGNLRDAGQYEASAEIADSLSPLFGQADALIEQGISYRQWGDAILATERENEISRRAFAAARARYRSAGDAFAQAAETLFNSTEYVPTLWSAIDAYQRGRHFSKSIPLLETYLHYEERLKQPAGLVAHGRALLAEGHPGQAMDSLQNCIAEFTRDPMRYEARLLAAQAAADSHEPEKAKQYLTENLVDGQLTPKSPVWRDSLYTLGELLYAESDMRTLTAMEMPHKEKIAELRKVAPELQQSIRRLSEAVDRYWPQHRAQSAAYLLARGQLLASRLPEAELENKTLLDAARRDFRQKANRDRQSALDRFTAIVRFMDAQERKDDLSDKQQAILRNSLLGQADTLKSMGRFAEAADIYRDMSLRYMNEPPALEALLGQSRMVRRLGRDREADLLISQAAVVLDRVSSQWDGRFDEMTRFDREDWRKYLQWMNDRLDQAKQKSAVRKR